MLLNKARFIKSFIIGASLLAMPLAAQAGNLVIYNTSGHPSTSVIDDGACSTLIEGGVTPSDGQPNVISENNIKAACMASSWYGRPCKADIYLSDSCTGSKIATVYLNISSGLQSLSPVAAPYGVTISGFEIRIFHL